MKHHVAHTNPNRNTKPALFAADRPTPAAKRLMRIFSISPEVAELLARLAGLGEQEAIR